MIVILYYVCIRVMSWLMIFHIYSLLRHDWWHFIFILCYKCMKQNPEKSRIWRSWTPILIMYVIFSIFPRRFWKVFNLPTFCFYEWYSKASILNTFFWSLYKNLYSKMYISLDLSLWIVINKPNRSERKFLLGNRKAELCC